MTFDLPQGWKFLTVADLAGIGGVVADGDWIESKDQDPNGDVRLIQLADIGEGRFHDRSARFLTSQKARELQWTMLETGDLLIARMPDPLGRSCLFPGVGRPSITAVDVFIWRPGKNGADPRWLMHAINSPQVREHLQNIAGGTTRQRVSGGNIKRLALPTPPKAMQLRIATKLDSLLDRSKSARVELNHVPKLIEHYRQAIFRKAFSGELTADWRLKNCVGSNPTDRRLSDLVEENSPIVYGVIQPGTNADYGIPLVRVCDLEAGAVLWQSLRNVSKDTHKEYSRSAIRNDDVLVSIVGTIGRVAIVKDAPSEANIARAIARIRVDKKQTDPRWVFYALQTDTIYWRLLSDAREVARKTLNLEQLRELSLRVPCLEEQQEVVKRIETVVRWLDIVESEQKRAARMLDRLDQATLAKGFRGELVAKNPPPDSSVTTMAAE